jgi:tetratricopeptide (TPR) repeat protein
MGRIIINRGRAFAWAGLGEPKLDLADYEAALQIFEEENSLPDIAEALWRTGEACVPPEDLYEKGLGNLLRSRTIFRELGDARKEIVISRSIGSAFTFLGLFPEAKRELGNVLRVAEKLGVFDELARAFGILGLLDEYEGKFAQASSKVLKALEYIKKTDVKYIQAFDLAALTRLYSKLGDLKIADQYFDKIKELPPEVLSTYLVRFMVTVSKGIYFTAKGRFKESNKIFEALATNLGPIFIRDYIWALEKQGRIEEAKIQREKVQKKLEQIKKWFEHANVQLNVMAPRTVQIGEVFEMQLDLVNVAKNPGTLIKVEGLIPSGCKVVSLPSFCSIQNNSIKMNNERIGPFQVEPIKIKVSFEETGFYDLDPILYYTNDLGESRTDKAKPVTITVQLGSSEEETKGVAELLGGKLKFKSEAADKAFNYLVSAFERDYLSLRMPREKSGWRTRMDVVRNAKVTMYSVYGRSGRGGEVTSELNNIGLIESRFFLGERGRGGHVLKLRICPEKEPVKRQINRQRE